MNELADLQIERLRGVEVQIQDHVRTMIVSERLKSGTRLPPTEELAGLWGVGSQTVQKALTPLVKEGLLARRPKAGTFVRPREAKLTGVGVYLTATLAESLFWQALLAAVREELQRAGIEPDIWTDPRPDEQRREPWMPMVRAAEHREFQALIVVGGGPHPLRWLRKLPVPATMLGNVPDLPGRVEIDLPLIADLGLQALAKQGCRSAGAILPISAAVAAAAGPRSRYGELCARFRERAGAAGLAVKSEWLRLLPREVVWRTPCGQEQYGYEEFLKLWRQPQRPAGLVVWPDTIARGVLLAVREKQVRVPAELKLVLHKNEAVDLFCPLPATFLVTSEREIARALVKQLEKQFRGEACQPILVPFRMRPHCGSR